MQKALAARHRPTGRPPTSCGRRSTRLVHGRGARWPPLFNPQHIDFVSKRVGNFMFSAQFYMMVDQAWVQ